MSDQLRAAHPFYMHDAIHAQPEAWNRAIVRNGAAVAESAAKLAAADPLNLVGIGTSYHAAQIGEYLFRKYAPNVTVRAMHSFDFALYGPALSAKSVVVAISHRGTKRYTRTSLDRARQAGAPTILITGERKEGGGGGARVGSASDAASTAGDDEFRPDLVLETVPQERSSAHTISFTGAIAVLALLAARVDADSAGELALTDHILDDVVPAALRSALETEDQMAELAKVMVNRRRIWIVGGGPAAVIAPEVALKIKETSYLQAEGLPVETMLHGPFQCAEPEDFFVLIAPDGAARERVAQLGPMIKAIGAEYMVVSDGTPESLRAGASGWCVVPQLPEPFGALTCLVPLQLLSYHLALVRGTNPDGFRLDDPRFAKAWEGVEL